MWIYHVRREIDSSSKVILRDLPDAPPFHSSESRHTRRAEGAAG